MANRSFTSRLVLRRDVNTGARERSMWKILKSVYRALLTCVLVLIAGAVVYASIESWNTNPHEVHSTLVAVCFPDGTCCENTRADPHKCDARLQHA
jgi:hypothetical protein